jgi:2-hydroxychromene-2-carboxylate isomerase
MSALDFWYDFHSPFAYLAATRIEDIARRRAISVNWRPLYLSRLIDAIGGRRSLEENAAFVAWYKQDLQDQAAFHGVSIRYHPGFPLRPARALRAAIRAGELGRAAAFSLAVFRAYWTDNRDISDLAVLGELAAASGLDARDIEMAATQDAYRERLEQNNATAIAAGVFGVPTIIWRGKLFFGNDRLDMLERSLSRQSAS